MRRKKISIIGALVLGLVMSGCGSYSTIQKEKLEAYVGDPHTSYVLDAEDADNHGTNNAYAKNCDVTIDGITWNVTGNSTMSPWRIGGKSLTGVDRCVYSKTAIPEEVGSIVVVWGAATSVTVNYINLGIYSTAAKAADGGEGDIHNITLNHDQFEANDSLTLTKPANETDSWAGRFYNICFNVTIGGSNKFIEFKSATFNFVNTSGGQIDPTGVSIDKSNVDILVGDDCLLTATVEPVGASGNVEWSSDDDSVASVDENGLVTANAAGTTSISATLGSFSASCEFTVYSEINYGTENDPLNISEAILAITLSGNTTTSQPLHVTGVVGSNTVLTQYGNYSEVWLKSDNGTEPKAFELYRAVLGEGISGTYSAADCFKDYTVVAKGFGTKHNGTYELTTSTGDPANPTIISLVPPAITSVSLNRDNAQIVAGTTVTLVASHVPANVPCDIIWETSNDKVATVDEGVVTGVHKGSATITAKVTNEIKAECAITVTDPEPIQGNGLELARTISVGDVVYLASKNNKQQYKEPSTSKNIYGIGISYTENVPSMDQIAFDVVAGETEGTFGFKFKDESTTYLCWEADNTLKTSGEINENSSWNVDIDNDGNATISNSAQSTRVIWWNHGNTRFACYENKQDNVSNFYYVQLWKRVAFDDILTRVSSFATLHGTETEVESVVSVSNVQLRFGARLSQIDWETFKNNWGVTGYGIMMAKENTLKNTYGRNSISEAYDENDTLTTISKGNGFTPDESGTNYVFSIRVNMTHYDVKICAAPYIIIGGLHYFFTEQDYSVKTLADYYLLPEHSGCELSNEALTILSNN